MKIEIVDGVAVVKLKKSEESALLESQRICAEIGDWLKDGRATAAREAAAHLDPIIKQHIDGVPAENEQEEPGNGEQAAA